MEDKTGAKWAVKCTAERIENGILIRKRERKESFGVPERIKVVALVACVMCLCNADRVVMSVAVVPLAAKHGWSSSFLGVVQVIHNCLKFWFRTNEWIYETRVITYFNPIILSWNYFIF